MDLLVFLYLAGGLREGEKKIPNSTQLLETLVFNLIYIWKWHISVVQKKNQSSDRKRDHDHNSDANNSWLCSVHDDLYSTSFHDQHNFSSFEAVHKRCHAAGGVSH